MSMDHFQKIYCQSIIGLLSECGLEATEDEIRSKVFSLAHRGWFPFSRDTEFYNPESYTERIFELLNVKEEEKSAITDAVAAAITLTEKTINEAPYRIVSDFREASEVVKAFVKDKSRPTFMFTVDTGHNLSSYAFTKLPSSSGSIDFLYGMQMSGNGCLGDYHVSKDQKYLGFFDHASEKAYCLLEPFDSLYWFNEKTDLPERGNNLREEVKKALQREIANLIAEMRPMPPVEISTIPQEETVAHIREAEAVIAKGKTVMDFADKVNIYDWGLHDRDLIQYVSDPGVFVSDKAEKYIQNKVGCNYYEELEKQWIAHCSAAAIFAQMVTYAENMKGAEKNESC